MKILNLEQIKQCIDIQNIIKLQIEGFKAYSASKTNIPPVGHLYIPEKNGSYHIKYGMFKGDNVFVVKLAGGFSDNPIKYGLPTVQGLMLIICAETGRPLVLLQDEGYLTNLRTAVAGAITAQYLAPKHVLTIGILGTGKQARLQVEMLKNVIPCNHLILWGRTAEHVNSFVKEMNAKGYDVQVAHCPKEVARQSNLIITTTAASEPLLMQEDLLPGTHITAVGADGPDKQELDPLILAKASRCVVDSKSQCLDHGETAHAFNQNIVHAEDILELGQIIANPKLGRDLADPSQITVMDLTGVAFQDIQIAKSVWFNSEKFISQD